MLEAADRLAERLAVLGVLQRLAPCFACPGDRRDRDGQPLRRAGCASGGRSRDPPCRGRWWPAPARSRSAVRRCPGSAGPSCPACGRVLNPTMSVSTTSSVKPLCPASGSVRATTTTRSQLMPDEMNVLEPLTIQSASLRPPSRTPEVRMPARSLPAPGSVIAIATIVSPLMMPGSQRCFCSSLPGALKYGPTTSFCSAQGRGRPLPTWGVSSSMTALNRKSSDPPPPNSSGMLNPIRPYLPAATYAERSTRRSALPLLGVRHDLTLDVLPGRLAERLVLRLQNESLHASRLHSP